MVFLAPCTRHGAEKKKGPKKRKKRKGKRRIKQEENYKNILQNRCFKLILYHTNNSIVSRGLCTVK